MKIIELNDEQQEEELLKYMKDVPWNAAKLLSNLIETHTFKEKMGQDSRIFYAKSGDDMVGFFTLVNQDFIPLPQYDRFIAMAWVDPVFRGRGIIRQFIRYAEEASGVDTIRIVTRHKGLYEKMGYTLDQEFTGTLHGKDYLYSKQLNTGSPRHK